MVFQRINRWNPPKKSVDLSAYLFVVFLFNNPFVCHAIYPLCLHFRGQMFSMHYQSRTKLKNSDFRNRSELDIISAILVETKQGCPKTHIMYKSNLSYTQLKSYLQLLLELGFLEKLLTIKKKPRFKSTSKGLEFLRKYAELKALINLEPLAVNGE